MSSDTRAYDVHVERIAVMSMVLLAALPAVMTVARTSPPLVAAIIALLAAVCALRDGSWMPVLERLKTFALQPAGMLLLAALLFMALSLTWTTTPERALRHLAHLVGSALLIGVLIASASFRRDDRIRFLMPVGLAVASILVIIHFKMSAPVNTALGAPIWPYYLNRTAVAIALFSPAVLAMLCRGRFFLSALALASLGMAAIAFSVSWSAKFALLAMLASAPLAFAAPRFFHRLAALGMLLALIFAPLYVGQINALIPQKIHDTVGYGSMMIRGEIWREYAALVWEKPIFGFGLEASNAVAGSPFAVALTEEQLRLLSFSHPHNAAVQIWFEFGAAGAILTASLLGLLLIAMEKLKGADLSVATLTAIGVFTVAFVSHGAWQAWWICLVGLVAYAFLLQLRIARRA